MAATTKDVSQSETADSLFNAPLLRAEDAARLLSVRTSWVYEAVRERRLPCVRVGRHIRFTRRMLDDWLAANTDR